MAATVFDTILKPDATPFTGRVSFRMIPSPRFRIADTVTNATITVEATAAGFISTTLVGGRYAVFVGTSQPFEITVPATDYTYMLHDLRTDYYGDGTFSPVPTDSGLIGGNYKLTDGVLQILNVTTGRWHAIWLSETPDPSTPTIGPEQNPGATVLHRVDGTSFQFKNVDTGNWQSVYITGETDEETLNVSDYLLPLSDNYRYENQRLQLYNTDTGLWHTIYVTGSGVSLAIAIAEGIA
jgi:hypothetical protein